MTIPTFWLRAGELAITGTGATSVTASFDEIVSARIVIVQVTQDGTAADAAISSVHANIANLAGTASAMTSIGTFPIGNPAAAKQLLWIGRTTATVPITASVCSLTSSGGDDLYVEIVTFQNVSTGTTLATVIENGSAGSTASESGTGTTVNDVGVTTLGVDRLACNFVGINDDATGIAAFAGASGGTWSLRSQFESSTGTDGTVVLMDAAMASAGTINGGSDAITSDGWGVVGFALIGTTAAAPGPSSFGRKRRADRFLTMR